MKRALLTLCVLAACEETALQEECAPEPSRAATIVQLADVTMGPPDGEGVCRLSGEVIRSFAGPATVGERLSRPIPCVSTGFGGSSYPREMFDGAPIVELQELQDGRLYESGPAGSGLAVLAAATEAPTITGPIICRYAAG